MECIHRPSFHSPRWSIWGCNVEQAWPSWLRDMYHMLTPSLQILVAGQVTAVNVIMGGVNLSIVDALSNPMFVYVPVAAQQELIEDIIWP